MFPSFLPFSLPPFLLFFLSSFICFLPYSFPSPVSFLLLSFSLFLSPLLFHPPSLPSLFSFILPSSLSFFLSSFFSFFFLPLIYNIISLLKSSVNNYVFMLYTSSSGLNHLITESLYPLTMYF